MKSKKFELNVSTLRKLGDQASKQVNGGGSTVQDDGGTSVGQRLTVGCTRPPKC